MEFIEYLRKNVGDGRISRRDYTALSLYYALNGTNLEDTSGFIRKKCHRGLAERLEAVIQSYMEGKRWAS